MTRVAVWTEAETESTVGCAFDELGNDRGWLRATSQTLFVHLAEQEWGRPIEFVYLGVKPQALIEQPWLAFVLLSKEVAA